MLSPLAFARRAAVDPSHAEYVFETLSGVEIEMRGISLERAAKAVAAQLPGSHIRAHKGERLGDFDVVDCQKRVWEVKRDAHLVELATPILKKRRDLEATKNIAQALKEAGAYVSEDAGLHIHMNAGPFEPRNAINLLTLVSQNEWHLFDELGVSHKRRWACQPLERFPVERLSRQRPKTRAAYGSFYADRELAGKNRGVNMKNFTKHGGTIEIRYFDATLEPATIERHHALVMAMARYTRKKKGHAKPGAALQQMQRDNFFKTLGLPANHYPAHNA